VPSVPDERHRNRRVRPRQLVRRDDVIEVLAWISVVALGAACAFCAAFV
jgi:hypothetical protein